MPDILHLKPEEIDTVEKRAKYSVCVVGCGQIGALYSVMFAEAGFKVTCADSDQNLLINLTRGRMGFSERELEAKLRSFIRAGTIKATGYLKNTVAQSNVIILTNSPKIDEKSRVDFSGVESDCKQIGSALQLGTLLLYAGMSSFGFTEGVVEEIVEDASGLKAGQDFGLAYVHSKLRNAASQEFIVAAKDKASLAVASLILSAATKNEVTQTMNVKAAEAATLFESARRDVSKALANEFAILCEKAGVDIFEALKLMNLGLLEPEYTPTINENSEKMGVPLLLENAENFEVKLRLPMLAVQVNCDVLRHAVNLTQSVLRDCGKTLRRARVAVLGATGKDTSGEMFVKMLEGKGARINLYDPYSVKSEESNPLVVLKKSLVEAVESCDCVVVLSVEDQFKRLSLKSLRAVMKTPSAIVDLAGLFERGRAESEGFLYRGLGRGVERV
jgi:nucleotide sugar dehydrogenase